MARPEDSDCSAEVASGAPRGHHCHGRQPMEDNRMVSGPMDDPHILDFLANIEERFDNTFRDGPILLRLDDDLDVAQCPRCKCVAFHYKPRHFPNLDLEAILWICGRCKLRLSHLEWRIIPTSWIKSYLRMTAD